MHTNTFMDVTASKINTADRSGVCRGMVYDEHKKHIDKGMFSFLFPISSMWLIS